MSASLVPRGVELPSGCKSSEERAQKALDCPCVADLRNGPCGTQFSEAFICFLKSTAEEKGSDCVQPFLSFQNCIKENPNAFGEIFLEEDGHREDSETTHRRKSVD
ncbi:mitochondrial intermembrane space import and assembly protein 40 homolog isoform X2 [Nymphaea colorata]|uniref:mitochondrial intermembrane space import and assembly protein 40 homolog isoform X2 n=1 Tax=Nymphaea colorata TaxID=210225 RepID=UPI00129D4417|nr:mitochondrial intermembrane space import and assembly protein 40 homolog isoform X2 [Nymphaea colorata]